MFAVGEIFWLEIEYEDFPDESKIRPAIIIDKREDSLFILISTTSQSPNEPQSYFDQFKIPILNWRKNGFPKASWGLSYRLIGLTENQLESVIRETDYIGTMNKTDLRYLINEIDFRHS